MNVWWSTVVFLWIGITTDLRTTLFRVNTQTVVVIPYNCSLRNNPEERSSQLLRG
jgi:hypothetical protein